MRVGWVQMHLVGTGLACAGPLWPQCVCCGEGPSCLVVQLWRVAQYRSQGQLKERGEGASRLLRGTVWNLILWGWNVDLELNSMVYVKKVLWEKKGSSSFQENACRKAIMTLLSRKRENLLSLFYELCISFGIFFTHIKIMGFFPKRGNNPAL